MFHLNCIHELRVSGARFISTEHSDTDRWHFTSCVCHGGSCTSISVYNCSFEIAHRFSLCIVDDLPMQTATMSWIADRVRFRISSSGISIRLSWLPVRYFIMGELLKTWYPSNQSRNPSEIHLSVQHWRFAGVPNH